MADIQPETTVASETVYSGKLIDVRKDTVSVANGKTTDREIVVHSETIAVLPILDDGRVVMVRQYRKAAERVLLEIPAGGIDSGESAEDAVRREMIEETGYHVGSVNLLCGFFTSPGFTTEYMHLFEASGLEPGEPTEPTDEIEVVTMSRPEVMQRIQSGDVSDAKTILALMFHQNGS